jgi:hypothetical protein
MQRRGKVKSGGIRVVPVQDDEFGAVAPSPRKDRREAVNATLKEAVASRVTVKPGGALTKTDLKDLLTEIIGDRAVRAAYQKEYGDKAVAQHLGDLRAWRTRQTDSPYSSVRHLLGEDEA